VARRARNMFFFFTVVIALSEIGNRDVLTLIRHILIFSVHANRMSGRAGSNLLRTRRYRAYILNRGRAIAQAVSRRLPTAAARVQTRVWSCGIL
jgi:hypothetical protein